MKPTRNAVLTSLAAFGLITGCGQGGQTMVEDAPGSASANRAEASATPSATGPFGGASASLPAFFDCVRENGGVVIAAHRGGPGPGYPENALETMMRTAATATLVFEVDISETRDGVLFLFHDRNLSRLTNAEGAVSDTDWATISRLTLRDTTGAMTPYNPPRLDRVLDWAVSAGVLLELDIKDNASVRKLIDAVRRAGAEENAVIITYSLDQAAQVARLAPELMITASARGGRDIAALEEAGVDRSRVIAWTGTESPDPAAFRRLEAEGVEPAFGTLGRPGQRLDDDYDGEDYAALVAQGVRLIATDRPDAVAGFLDTDDLAISRCGR